MSQLRYGVQFPFFGESYVDLMLGPALVHLNCESLRLLLSSDYFAAVFPSRSEFAADVFTWLALGMIKALHLRSVQSARRLLYGSLYVADKDNILSESKTYMLHYVNVRVCLWCWSILAASVSGNKQPGRRRLLSFCSCAGKPFLRRTECVLLLATCNGSIAKMSIQIEQKNWWSQELFRLSLSAAVHPFEYAKLLIQIGYEPIAPRPSHTLLGRPVLALPSVFEYVGYIYKKKGFCGLYRGATPRVLGSFVSGYVYSEVAETCPFGKGVDEEVATTMSEEEKVMQFFQETARAMIAQFAAVLASHPFQVITVRTIAQFVGGEERYVGIYSSVREIYQNEGLRGFFAGIVPRVIGELLSLWISSCLTFVINSYLIKDKDLKLYTRASMSFIAVAVTYPFTVVSRVMSVNNSGLAAGCHPHMPVYINWTDCWSQLKSQNQLKRGSSILFRYYTGPHGLKEGKPYVLTPQTVMKHR